MTKIDLLTMLKNHADEYRSGCSESILSNSHMNDVSKEQAEGVDQEVVDAVLVDFINLIGRKMGVDYALYTSDLK